MFLPRFHILVELHRAKKVRFGPKKSYFQGWGPKLPNFISLSKVFDHIFPSKCVYKFVWGKLGRFLPIYHLLVETHVAKKVILGAKKSYFQGSGPKLPNFMSTWKIFDHSYRSKCVYKSVWGRVGPYLPIFHLFMETLMAKKVRFGTKKICFQGWGPKLPNIFFTFSQRPLMWKKN